MNKLPSLVSPMSVISALSITLVLMLAGIPKQRRGIAAATRQSAPASQGAATDVRADVAQQGSSAPAKGAAPQSVAERRAVNERRIAAGREPKLSRAQVAALLRRKIKYVFVLYQENRSFDSYFGTFPNAEGIFSHPAKDTPGFYQPLTNVDGTAGVIHPFRIGPKEFASDTDDVDHSHPGIVAKMNIEDGVPRMDQFAMAEERKHEKPAKAAEATVEEGKPAAAGNPSLAAKQMGELAMAYEDCDTVPFLWRYADRFVLFDHIFQEMTGPSTLGNISIIAAQTGQTQWALHPDEAYKDNGARDPGVPVLNDNDPFWGSQLDPTPQADKMPVNPRDMKNGVEYGTALNLTFASLPLTLLGEDANTVAKSDTDATRDLADVQDDIPFIASHDKQNVAFGWYEEGYGKEPTDTDDDDDPVDAYGLHASYVTHHNGPQYFGYVANNPKIRSQLHSLQDFFTALDDKTLPKEGGVFFVKGGSRNIFHLKPADPDAKVQKRFLGDDDHPAYSDSQISEAMLATAINKIAASPYWSESAIIITWDDSEGDYDHVPPPIRAKGPDGSPISDGPRVPLILISPYARAHYVAHEAGNHASVVKFVDTVFARTPLALLPDEQRGRALGEKQFGQSDLGPQDALTSGVTDLADAFSPLRLSGKAAPLPPAYAEIPEALVKRLPAETKYGCAALGIVTTDRQQKIRNAIPHDFNPRPLTNPSQ